MSYLALLLAIPLIRFLINLNSWLFLHRSLQKQRDYVFGLGQGASDEAKEKSRVAEAWITSNTLEIKKRLKAAGVGNPTKAMIEPIGYGQAVRQHYGIMDNILLEDMEVMRQAKNLLRVGKGYYRTNWIQSLNPIYWLEVLFFLPKSIVSASGIESTSKGF